MIKRPPQLDSPPAIKFIADGLRDKLAAILLPPVDISYQIIWQSDGYAIRPGHIRTPGSIISHRWDSACQWGHPTETAPVHPAKDVCVKGGGRKALKDGPRLFAGNFDWGPGVSHSPTTNRGFLEVIPGRNLSSLDPMLETPEVRFEPNVVESPCLICPGEIARGPYLVLD